MFECKIWYSNEMRICTWENMMYDIGKDRFITEQLQCHNYGSSTDIILSSLRDKNLWKSIKGQKSLKKSMKLHWFFIAFSVIFDRSLIFHRFLSPSASKSFLLRLHNFSLYQKRYIRLNSLTQAETDPGKKRYWNANLNSLSGINPEFLTSLRHV